MGLMFCIATVKVMSFKNFGKRQGIVGVANSPNRLYSDEQVKLGKVTKRKVGVNRLTWLRVNALLETSQFNVAAAFTACDIKFG